MSLFDVKTSLLKYKGISYGEINKLLREGSIPTDKNKMSKDMLNDPTVKDIINIDSVMHNDGSLKGKVLYRGIHGIIIEEQGVLINKAYSSSSTNIDVALNFVEGQCCIIAFEIPPEVKFFKYEDIGRPDEKEILIHRNTQFVELRHTNTYKNVRIYSCILKLYAMPIITREDIEKQKFIDQQTAKFILEDEDEDFEDMLAEIEEEKLQEAEDSD